MPKEIEISISRDGRVKVQVSGVKGPACMEYARLFERVIGTIEEEEHSSEYYEEGDERVGINVDGGGGWQG